VANLLLCCRADTLSFSQLLTLARWPTIKDKSTRIQANRNALDRERTPCRIIEAIGRNHLSVQSVQSVTDSPTRSHRLSLSLLHASTLLLFYSSTLLFTPNSSLPSSSLLNTSPPSRTYITYLLLVLLRPVLPFFCIFSFVDNKHPTALFAHPPRYLSATSFIITDTPYEYYLEQGHEYLELRHWIQLLTQRIDTDLLALLAEVPRGGLGRTIYTRGTRSSAFTSANFHNVTSSKVQRIISHDHSSRTIVHVERAIRYVEYSLKDIALAL
jgi:hypothetical protein